MSGRTAHTEGRFKPYSSYRDSGVRWYGRIPDHWKVRRLKHVADVRFSNVDKHTLEGQLPVRLCNYVDVYRHDAITSALNFMPATATREQLQRFELRAGDVLITKDSESWTDIAVPTVVLEDLPAVLCGYHLALIRPRPSVVNGQFLARTFSAVGPRDQFHISANGITRFGLGTDSVTSAVFAVPPMSEQRTIVTFLDRETARLDELVAKKKRLIALLQEQRAALINRALTKGLDRRAAFTDSAIPWLGLIPGHWTVRPLRYVATLQRGFDLAFDIRDDGSVPIVSSAGLIGFHSQSKVTAPGVVTGRYGSIGQVFYITQDFWPLNTTLFVHTFWGNDKRFIFWLLSALAGQIEAESEKSAVPGVDRNDLHRIKVAVPPLREQERILQSIDKDVEQIDSLDAEVRRGMEKAAEYRSALISAAVTGQIDVREEVA